MKRLILPLLAIMALVAASCSSERDGSHILDAVPADATSVTFVNLDRLAKDGVDADALAKGPLPLHSGMMAFVTLSDGTSLRISDIPEPDSLAAAGYLLDGEAGQPLTTYARQDGSTIVADTKRGVAYYTVFSPSRALQTISDVSAACDKLTFASNKGIADFFDKKAGEAAVYGAIGQSLVGAPSAANANPQDAGWIAFDVKEESGVADLTAVLMEGSGKEIEIKGLQKIDTDFLRYVPADMNIVAAAGLTPGIDWNPAGRLLAVIASPDVAGFFAVASPYLKAIDGTVAVAARVDPDSPMESKMFAMARMPREKINDLVAQIGTIAAMAGAKTTPVSDNMSCLTVPGVPGDFFIGEVDGYFAFASFPLDSKAENPFTADIEGHQAAAIVSTTEGAIPAPQFPAATGINARFALDKSEAHLRLSFPGSEESPLAVIASALLR